MGQFQLRDITPWNERILGECQMYLDPFFISISLDIPVYYLVYYLNTFIEYNVGLKIDVFFLTKKLCIFEENYGKKKYNNKNKNIITIIRYFYYHNITRAINEESDCNIYFTP
jgi:hypothetical protein